MEIHSNSPKLYYGFNVQETQICLFLNILEAFEKNWL